MNVFTAVAVQVVSNDGEGVSIITVDANSANIVATRILIIDEGLARF